MEELQELIITLADGNIGAGSILIELVNDYPIPTIIIITKCNELGIKGSDFYVLGQDICERDYYLMEYLCRSVPSNELVEACSKQDYSGKDLLKSYINFYNKDK